MALPNIHSRRKRAAAETPDIYIYDDFPEKIRVQIIHIVNETVPESSRDESKKFFDATTGILRKEFGVFKLYSQPSRDPRLEFSNWLLSERDIDKVIDGIELTFRAIDVYVRDREYYFRGGGSNPDNAIAELNARLQEACIGYQYDDGMIVRVDSRLIHSEVVVPALRLVSSVEFAAVDEEFREAHARYRDGDYETCLVDCAKAFESCLKVIGAARHWAIQPTDSASKLLNAAFSAGFVPTYLQAEFSALRSLLESGVPSVRNKQGGHGAGTSPRIVPAELAAFQLHQTAAVIVFLVSHHKANA